MKSKPGDSHWEGPGAPQTSGETCNPAIQPAPAPLQEKELRALTNPRFVTMKTGKILGEEKCVW